MRFEELSVSDLRLAAAHCDTLLVACGGMAARPPHLPVGSSAFILRKLRDGLDAALGGRVLSLPLWGFDAPGAERAYAVLPDGAWAGFVQGYIRQIEQDLKFSRIVVLTDSLDKEALLREALKTSGHRLKTLVWWRDGLTQDAKGGAPFVPGGELETSLILGMASRLVDLSQQSAEHYGAQGATVERGRTLWQEIVLQLRSAINE